MHGSETNVDLAMIETFFNTLDNDSNVSIIARSTFVSLRCKGSATFQDGAGNCEEDLSDYSWFRLPVVTVAMSHKLNKLARISEKLKL